MNAQHLFNSKTVLYFGCFILAAVLFYLVGNLLGFYPERRPANNASSSKIARPLIPDKQSGKTTLEGDKKIPGSNQSSDTRERENATDPQGLSQRIENLPGAFSNLVVVGIMNGGDGRSQAIIENRDTKTQGIYTEGSEIHGARVMKISKTGVILSVDGKPQVLAVTTQQSEPLQEEEELPTDESNWWEKRSYLGYAEVTLKARLKPFVQDGTQEGFEVKSIVDHSPLKAIGLEDGDIIKNINGEPIDSDLDLLVIDDAIKNGDSYTVSVERNGRLITLPAQVK